MNLFAPTKLSIIWSTVIVAVCLFASLWRLQSVPPLWWDEGWTLSVARNWLERGHYSRLLAGRLTSSGLEASPTVTASVYLSFRFFGIGVVQARAVGVVYTMACLALFYCLVRRLYNLSIAVGTLLVLTLLPAYIDLFPIYMGRQVLGEMPALLFLIAGYVSILAWPHRPQCALALVVVSWSIALSTKLQIVPFWSCSILILIAITLYQREWKSFWLWTISFVGSLFGARLLATMWEVLLQAKADIAAPITGLYQVTAAVESLPSRMFALIVTILFGIPTLLGLCYGFWSIFKDGDVLRTHNERVKLALLVFASSWFGWFVVFSVGWIRYVFPATFIGSMFVAAMIYDFTRGYNVAYTVHQSIAFFRDFNKETTGALLVLIIVVTSVPRTALALYKTYVLDSDTSVEEAANFINSHTPPGALVETYDSELFFLLNRPYHYPPDQIHVNLIRRTFLYEDNIRIGYNPLVANPDYLVVGPHSKQWRLYDDVVKAGAFRLVRKYSRYKIYERVR